MKKILAFALVIAVFLSACGQIKADVAGTPEAKATQALVQQYIKANQTYDADMLMSLYAENDGRQCAIGRWVIMLPRTTLFFIQTS